jgi:hypothetical protein
MNVLTDKYEDTCIMCTDNKKEDTQHLILHYDSYRQERQDT